VAAAVVGRLRGGIDIMGQPAGASARRCPGVDVSVNEGFFFEKKQQETLAPRVAPGLRRVTPQVGQRVKVFWFFFSADSTPKCIMGSSPGSN
jgi:hypothetical protein